jgi:putative transposase
VYEEVGLSVTYSVMWLVGLANGDNRVITMSKAMRALIKRVRFPFDIMLTCVRWYLAYALSLRNLEEMMEERGLFVDHSTIHRWVIKFTPILEEAFRRRKRKRGIGSVGKSWRMDETYIKIGGEDRYLYRAVDKQGNTVDFLLTAKRNRGAAHRFFTRAVKNNLLPRIANIDKSGANKAGLEDYNRENGTEVVIRQCKYLNNIVEQDHRAVKRRTRPMLGFKKFRCARIILGGIEIMHMIRKGQMTGGRNQSAAQQFYSLAV